METKKENVVREIKEKITEINNLFEVAARDNIKFDCSFTQDKSFGHGKVGHLVLNAYHEIQANIIFHLAINTPRLAFFAIIACNPNLFTGERKAKLIIKSALLKKQYLAFYDNKDQKPNWVFCGIFVQTN